MKKFNFNFKSIVQSKARWLLTIFAILTLGVGQMWAWDTNVYLNGNFTGNNWNQATYQFTWQWNSTDGKFYIPVYATGSTQYFRLWTNNHVGPSTNNSIITTSGEAASSYSENNWKYTGNAGIINICIDQTGGKDWNPWVWYERPTIKFKHPWNGSSWTEVNATDNNNGTYKYKGKYGGTAGFNAGPSGDLKYKTSATTVTGSPSTGDYCLFEWNASGYKWNTGEGSDYGTFTITKLCGLTYDGNGRDGGAAVPSSLSDQKYGTSVTLSSAAMTRTGYTLTGWNTANDGSGIHYDLGESFTFSNKTNTLYAEWTINNYDITYDPAVASHCTYTTTPDNANYNTTVNLEITPDDNYVVSSVTTSPSVTVTDNGDNTYSFTMPASDVTVTVVTALASVTVNYGAGANGSLAAEQGGESIGVSGSTVDGGSTVNFTASPNTGYEVEAWYTNSTFDAGRHDAGATSYDAVANSTLNVYVQFLLSTYNITYNLNGGTNHEDNPATYRYTDETITLQAPTKAGYYFGGWYTSSTFTGGTEKTTIPNNSTGNVTLYAKWIGFSNLTVKPTTLHTGAKTDTIVVGDAITITPILVNAPATHYICPTLYKKDEGQWVEQDITFGVSSDVRTIAAKPLSGEPLPSGEYKIKLSLRNGANCSDDEIITKEKEFEIGEQTWHIYGGAFWAWTPWASVPNVTDVNGDGVQLRFLPTATTGQYYFGPFRFKNENDKDYRNFRLYNKINARDVFATSSGNFTLNNTFDEKNKVTLIYSSNQYANSFDASLLTDKDYYLFVQDGKMWVSATRPVLAPRVEFYVSGDGGTSKYYSNETTLKDGVARKISFYHPGGTVTLTTRRYLLGVGWTETPAQVALTLDNATRITTAITSANKGVYVADLTWNAANDHVDISNVVKYDGDYWVRTNHSPGGWDSYKVDGNLFTYSAYAEQHEGFTHYFMKWVEGASDDGRNVKFDVANEYNSSLAKNRSGFAEDDYANGYGNLKQNANVRFMYNEHTNAFSRAYLSGSSLESDLFLVLKGDNTSGNYLWTSEAKSAHKTTNGTSDWAFFSDTQNWVYQLDVYATPGTRIKLTGNFTDKNNTTSIQYFKGSSGAFDDSHTEELIGGSGSTAYGMRVVYDFKTNRLISAWTPPVGGVSGAVSNVDIILERYKQNAATQITFNAGASLSAKIVMGAIRFAYNDLKGKVSSWNSTSRPLLKYFISFPFDVNVSDLFGLNSAYGDAYVIERYAGDKRAEKGFFRGDGTTTFWEELTIDDVMHANEGYCLILDNDYFNGTVGHIWDNKTAGTSVYLYFPSTTSVGSIGGSSQTISVPAHPCTIDRSFVDSETKKTLNHQITDSHWNLMGVPTFDNTLSSVDGYPGAIFLDTETEGQNFKYYYGWNSSNNQFSIANAADTTFKAMHCYMVQYTGDVTFTGTAPTPAAIAARRAPAQKKYEMELQVLNGEDVINRTYVELRDDASDDFELSEDVYMSPNNKVIDVYTFAGDYDVAANVLSVKDQVVPVGVTVRQAGTYAFSMSGKFDGTVTLVDTQNGTETNLALNNYEVYLEKGTNINRFYLKINIKNSPTAIDGVEDGSGSLKDGKVHKFIMNDQMYIIKDGVIYDARGAKVK